MSRLAPLAKRWKKGSAMREVLDAMDAEFNEHSECLLSLQRTLDEDKIERFAHSRSVHSVVSCLSEPFTPSQAANEQE